jgi:hypothetical protein
MTMSMLERWTRCCVVTKPVGISYWSPTFPYFARETIRGASRRAAIE